MMQRLTYASSVACAIRPKSGSADVRTAHATRCSA